MSDKKSSSEFSQLLKVIEKLLDPNGGCPWDLKQTHKSLLPYLIEESYEFIHEVEENNTDGMKDELGDILLQVLLHSRIAEKVGQYGIEDVAKNLREKLVYRHPHVFGETSHEKIDSDEVLKRWGDLKTSEKILKGEKEEDIDKIPSSYLRFPSLMSAYKIGKKTKDATFDWDNPQQVLEKVEEEFIEFKEELNQIEDKKDPDKIKEELGDLFFTLAQLSRHLKLNPEEVLREANLKFVERYNLLNHLIKKEKNNKKINELTFEEKEFYWKKVKELSQK